MQVGMVIQHKGYIHGCHHIELNVVKEIYCSIKRALLPPYPSWKRAGRALAPRAPLSGVPGTNPDSKVSMLHMQFEMA